MRRKVLTAFAVLAISLLGTAARAADHLDGPQAKMDPAADITDVFAWMSADKAKVYLILNVAPLATTASNFSTAVKYVIHVNSSTAFQMTPTNTNVICQFDAAKKIACWVVSGSNTLDYVTGDASNTAGITSTSGKTKVFAGLRDDPFFFNLDGFKHAAKTIHDSAGALAPTFDNAGCPKVDSATSTVLVNQLKQSATGGAPADFFKALNVLSIVVAVDTSLLTGNGARPVLGVWGSTNK